MEKNEFGDKSFEHDYGTKDNPCHMDTINQHLEGKCHPITGVEFERKTVERPDGKFVEGVFPKFESKYAAKIDEELFFKSDSIQFKECNKQLYENMEKDKKEEKRS